MINYHVKIISVNNGPTQRSRSLEDEVNRFIDGHPEISIIKIEYAAVDKGTIDNYTEHTTSSSCFIFCKTETKKHD